MSYLHELLKIKYTNESEITDVVLVLVVLVLAAEDQSPGMDPLL